MWLPKLTCVLPLMLYEGKLPQPHTCNQKLDRYLPSEASAWLLLWAYARVYRNVSVYQLSND